MPSSSMWIVILITAVALIVALVAWRVLKALLLVHRFYTAVHRRNELRAWALGKGLDFDPSRKYDLDDRFENFKCLHRGHDRFACNVMEGQWTGLPILAFDYHYATMSDEDRGDHYFSAVIFTSPVPLKPLYIRREGFLDKLTEFVGFDDIDFESSEFSRTFYVRSPDKRWAYDVVHQRMMEHLLNGPDVSIQFDFMYIIAWGRRRFKPSDFSAAAEIIRGVLGHLPEYVIRQQKGESLS